MSTLEERLIELRGGESVAAFAKKCDIQENTMRLYFSGSVPSLDKAQKIAINCGVSLEWLASGKKPKFNTDNLKMDSGALKLDVFNYQLSFPEDCGDAVSGIMLSKEIVDSFNLSDKCFGIVIKGDSMSPKLCEGDIAIIDSQISKVAEDGIYLFNCDNNCFIKQIQRTGSVLIIKSINSDYDDWSKSENAVSIVGKMKLSLKKS